MNKKTLLITAAEEMLFRNLFSTPFWPELLKRLPEWRIVLVVNPKLKEYAERLYASNQVVVDTYTKGSVPRWADAVFTFARRGIKNGTNVWSNWRAYERGDAQWLPTFIKHLVMLILGNASWYKRLLRVIMLRVPSDKDRKRLFDTYKPTAYFGTSMTNFDVDVLLGIEAKQRGVPIIGMTRSWDNLSSHGLLRVVPDFLLLQNKFLEDMAYRYQDMSPGKPRSAIVGLPHYDAYLDKTQVESREEFFFRNNLDENKKLIVYCGMGEMLFPKEGDLIDIFEEEIASGRIDNPVQVLYSAHPKFLSSRDKVASLRHLILADEVRYTDKDAVDRESEGVVHVRKLINLLAHADVVVMGASTLAIDAVALGVPVICIGFDGKGGEVLYWHSVKRFYDSYTHFEALMETGAIRLARSVEEMDSMINECLRSGGLDKGAQKKVIDRFVAPFDGKRSLGLAKVVAEEVEKRG